MTLQQTISAIEAAARRLLELEGNTEIRDNLIRAEGNLLLLKIAAENGNLESLFDILQKLTQ